MRDAVHPAYVAGFVLAVLPLVATPGASLALLTRHVATSGRGAALPVILGTATGIHVHALLAVAGLSAVVLHSATAFTAVKLAGAAYLVGLGVWMWRSAGAGGTSRPQSARTRRLTPRSPYLQALLGTVLNPKAAAIYLTLAPHFVDPAQPLGPQFLALAGGHAAVTGVWLLGWGTLLGAAGAVLARPRVRAAFARVSGGVLVGLGVRAAVS